LETATIDGNDIKGIAKANDPNSSFAGHDYDYDLGFYGPNAQEIVGSVTSKSTIPNDYKIDLIFGGKTEDTK